GSDRREPPHARQSCTVPWLEQQRGGQRSSCRRTHSQWRVSFGVEDILDPTGVGFLLVKQRFPVGWHPPHRARHRLVSGMRLRRGQARTFEEVFRAIVPEPPLTGLIAGDDRVAGRVLMLCRVLIGGSTAAADMTAFGTSAQMEPPAARRPTF